MKILVIGGNGTIGKRVVTHFKPNHKVIVAGRSSGDLLVDITNTKSIVNLFENTGKIDAIISIAGEAKWALFDDLSEDDFYVGLKSKLMGQVNLVRIGQHFINPNGSITLTTGVLADDPVKMTTSAAMVNGAIHSFVMALKLDMKNNVRVNVVSPGLVEDSAEKYKDYFPGYEPISMNNVIGGYLKSVEGNANGEIIRIYQN